jgi:hypothetical protein
MRSGHPVGGSRATAAVRAFRKQPSTSRRKPTSVRLKEVRSLTRRPQPIRRPSSSHTDAPFTRSTARDPICDLDCCEANPGMPTSLKPRDDVTLEA